MHKGTVKRVTREDEHRAQDLKPGREGPFRLLLNSMFLESYTGVPAALRLVARFFRGVGYPEHTKNSLSHRQSIPNLGSSLKTKKLCLLRQHFSVLADSKTLCLLALQGAAARSGNVTPELRAILYNCLLLARQNRLGVALSTGLASVEDVKYKAAVEDAWLLMPSASWAQFSRALLALGRKGGPTGSAPRSVPVSALKLAQAVLAIRKTFKWHCPRDGLWAVPLDKL